MSTTMTTDMTTADSSGTTDGSESGSESGTESGSESGSSGSDSSTGTNPDAPYGECDLSDPKNPTCATEGDECNLLFMGDGQNWCSIPCDVDMDCPAPSTGDAVAQCSMFYEHCALSCDDGMGGQLTCPDGMDCVPSGMFQRCTWPAP
jgi:hypothetical protein